jgi:hypothetical protein
LQYLEYYGMKRIFITLLTFLICANLFGQNSEEISLLDKTGEAKAYITDDLTIYLWDGVPVAYLDNSNNTTHLYEFNGHHLGWFTNGILYNNEGDIVGTQKSMTTMMTSLSGGKGIKRMLPYKHLKQTTPIKPILSSNWSSTELATFLSAGKD